MLTLTIAGQSFPLFLVVMLGLGVGFVAGMFGVGGGFILTPILISVFRLPAPLAVGTAMCQTVGTSLASFLRYRALGRGEPRFDLILMGGSLIGVDAGGRLLRYLTGLAEVTGHTGKRVVVVNAAVDALFIVVLTVTAVFVVVDALTQRSGSDDTTRPGPLARVCIPPYVDLPGVGLRAVSLPVLCYLGVLLGLASGLMGIGGGVLLMPVLLFGYGISARNAAATGVLLLFVTVAVGTFRQALAGSVSLPLALALLIGSSIGAQLGALTTNRLPNQTLRLLFAGLVILVVGRIAIDLKNQLGF